MKKTIDLTNYENFYKNAEELEELRRELYDLAYEAHGKSQIFFDDEELYNEYYEFEALEDGGYTEWLREDLTIEQLMYFIKKNKGWEDGFWVFAHYDKRRNKLFSYPEYLHPLELKKLEYNIWRFEFPEDEEEEEE